MDIFLHFWDFLTQDLTDEDYIEVRLFNVVNNDVYSISKKFCQENNVVYKNNGAQIFFNAKHSFFEFRELLNNEIVAYGCKLCYSLAPRQYVNNEIGGSYNYINFINLVGFDIEKTSHENTKDKEQKELLKYIDTFIIPLFKKTGLKHYCLIDSGAGYHLLYKINHLYYNDDYKRWFKIFVKELSSRASNEFYKVDCLTDFTRVFAIPGTPNIKREKMVKLLRLDNKVNNNFKFKKKKEKKYKGVIKSNHKINNNLTEEPLIKFMMTSTHKSLRSGGILSRNAYLELQLAYLLRDNNIVPESITELINKINQNMNKKINVDPKYLRNDKNFNTKVVNKWTLKCCGIKLYP